MLSWILLGCRSSSTTFDTCLIFLYVLADFCKISLTRVLAGSIKINVFGLLYHKLKLQNIREILLY